MTQQKINTAHKPEATTPQTPANQLAADAVSFTITQNGSKLWVLDVAHVVHNRQRTQAGLSTVKGTYFTPDGKALATFIAPHGVYDQSGKHITLTGGVRVVSSDGKQTLTASETQWATTAETVNATGNVQVTLGNGMHSQGNACQFTMDFSAVKLQGGTSTTLGQ